MTFWVAGAAVGGALIGAYSSNKASSAQENSANAAIAAQKESEKTQTDLNKPFRDNGLTAQNRLMYLLGLSPQPGMQTKDQIRQSLLSQFTTPGAGSIGRYTGRRDANGFPLEEVMSHAPGTVNEAGLQAAIDKQFAAQNQGNSDYGSLTRNFGQSDFNTDPGYQFRLEQGQKAMERSQAARGGLLSGGAIKAASDYNQGMASQEYGNAFNRFQTNRANILNPLQSLSGAGQTASGVMGQAAMQGGQDRGNYLTQAGNANSAGYIGQGNAINNALGQGVNAYQNYQLMNKLNMPAYGAGGATNQTANFNNYGPGYSP